jgi:hypothetical protein
MNPKIWGPHAWVFLHTITFNFPENPTPEQQKVYKEFFESLIHIIPCDKCRYNYIKKIKKYPVNVESRMKLVEWLLHIHNDVNKSTGKEEITMPELIKKYTDMYSSKQELQDEVIEIKKKYINYILVALIIVIVYSIYKKNN